MKQKLNDYFFPLICCLFFLLLFGSYFFKNNFFSPPDPAVSQTSGLHENEMEGEEGGLSKMQANIERELFEFEKTRDPALDEVPRERLRAARKYMKIIQEEALVRTAVPNIDWEERGPNNVGGRTRAILVDATDSFGNTVWVGSVGGGLWRTTTFNGPNPFWSNVNPQFINLAVTSIVQDPSDHSIMYVGTGEGFGNTDAIRGDGIFKSSNFGATWTFLPSTLNSNFHYVQDLIISESGHLFAATKTGVYFSNDGGTTFNLALNGALGASDDAADLELGADGDLYVTFGLNNSPGSVYKSDFATWGAVTGWASTWTNITPPADDFERIEIATAPSNANRVYAVCQGAGTNEASYLYRSINGGASWTSLSVPGFCDQGSFDTKFTRSGAFGQAWYDLILAVDPGNPDRVYMGGVDAMRSDDAGNNWIQVTGWAQIFSDYCSGQDYVHADHHVMVYVNGDGNKLIMGTDGGISYTTNARDTTPTLVDKNLGYNVTQFYACAMHPESGSNYFFAGAQDNGTQKFTAAGLGGTTAFSGGDGAFCHIDQDNSNVQISAFIHNQYYVSTNGGTNRFQRFFNGSGRFINPTDYDNDANILYCANGLSDYLRWNNPSVAGTSADIVPAGFLGQISAITCAPNASNRVWMGDGNGNLYRLENAHATPTVTTFAAPSTGYITSIDVDPNNGNRLLVCRSNYGVVSVYEVSISGSTATWTDIEGNIPDMPVRWGIFNPYNSDQAILATELSIWSTTDIDGATTGWDFTVSGMELVRVDMLQYRESDMMVAAATHGRGLYTSLLSPNPALSNPSACQLDLSIPDASCTAYNRFPIKVTSAPGTQLGTDVFLTNVKLIIEHTFDADLDIKLFSPNGTVVELSTDNGSVDDNYGDPTDVTCTAVTDFSMNAPTSITSGTAPFIGTFIPEGDFADFNDGSDPKGTWFLQICDNASQDVGQLEFVELVLRTQPGCTSLAGPVDGAGNVTVGSGLSWPEADGTPLGYRLNVGTSSGGTDILNNFDAGNVTSYNPLGDFPAGATIYVTITPYNDVGNAIGCTEASFMTSSAEPGCLTTLFDADFFTEGNMFDITNLGTLDLVLTSFEANDDAQGFSRTFRVYYTNGDTHVGVETNSGAWTLLGEAGAISMGENNPTPVPIGGLLVPPGASKGLYVTETFGSTLQYTQGTSVHDDGILKIDMSVGKRVFYPFVSPDIEGQWNGTICYEVIPLPPNCTSLTSPLNNATLVPVNSNLSWAAAAGVPTGYRLSVGTSMGGTDIVNDLDVGNVTMYDPVGNLPFESNIYVTITPYNTGGDASGCLEESFMTGNPTLSNPSDCQLNLPISDNSCTTANQFQINVTGAPGTQLGTDVELTNAKLIVEHSFDQDLIIRLYSPNGESVQFTITQGGGGDNYGDPTDVTCTAVTDFTMGAATIIFDGTAPFIGEYRPHVGDFADFNDGSDPNGIWILEVCDNSATDVGELEFVELVFGSLATGCEDDLVIPSDPIAPTAYYADNSITSDGRVASGAVEFYALMSVLLSPEFEVELGAEFLAETGIGCTPLLSPDVPEGFYVTAPAGNTKAETKAGTWLSLHQQEDSPYEVSVQINLPEAADVTWHIEDLSGHIIYMLPATSSFAEGKQEYLLTLPDLGLTGEYVLVANRGGIMERGKVKF